MKLLLNILMAIITFTKLLMNTVQIKIRKVFDDMIADMISNKKLSKYTRNYLLEVENERFLFFSLYNLFFLWLKILD